MSNSAICGTYVMTGCEKPSHGPCECCEEHCQCHATTIGIVTCPQCHAQMLARKLADHVWEAHECPSREDWERLTAERDAARAAARELWQALNETVKVADAELSCWVTSNSLPPEIESLYASTQDLRELLAKHSDLIEESHE